MRLVVLSRHYPEYCFRYASAFARKMDVLLVLDQKSARTEFDLKGQALPPRLSVHLADLGFRRGVWGMFGALRKIRAFRPDFVHVQEIPDGPTQVMMLLLKPFSKLILTVHDPNPHSGADSRHSRVKFWLVDKGRQISDLLVVHGEYCARALLAQDPQCASRLVKSQHGVLMVPENSRVAAELRSALLFGRMQQYKGLEILISASDILRQRGIEHKIILAGHGQEADRLAPMIRERSAIQPHLRFITPTEAAEFFRRSGIVVMPYLNATQSGVAAAALANGRPVVASRVGGLPDLVKDGVNGLLVEPGDPVALADALQKIFTDQELYRRLSEGAHRSASGSLNWDRITDDLYAELSNYFT